jgi:putative PIN family toxin of toxin-antitoxin system
MIKVVLDTNVLISAFITKGKSRMLLSEIIEGKAQLILSKEILEEFAEVAADDKLRKYIEEQDVEDILRIVGGIAEIVEIKSRFKAVKQDPGDDIILRTARDGEVDYIVSGDEHILSLKEFRGIKILAVNEMLKLL